MKVKVYTTDTIKRKVSRKIKDTRDEQGHWRQVYQTAEYQAQLEVYVDVDRLIKDAIRAFQNKNRRFVRGPVEVRAVNLVEIPGTQHQETF
jgi:hypothetical protein